MLLPNVWWRQVTLARAQEYAREAIWALEASGFFLMAPVTWVPAVWWVWDASMSSLNIADIIWGIFCTKRSLFPIKSNDYIRSFVNEGGGGTEEKYGRILDTEHWKWCLIIRSVILGFHRSQGPGKFPLFLIKVIILYSNITNQIWMNLFK